VPRPAHDAPQPLVGDRKIKPLDPDSAVPLAVQAYKAIRKILFRGCLQQGEALRMEQLCRGLGTSKQPISDAMKRLAHEGYVTVVPKVGCRVRVYTTDEVREYYRLYASADGLLAELAAQRATDKDLQQLEAISAAIGQLVAQPLPGAAEARRYRKLNRDFHRRVRDIAGSWPVAEAAEAMHDRSDFFLVTMRHAIRSDRVQRAHDEHEALLRALRARDAAAARAAMEQHVLAAGARLWEPDAMAKGRAARKFDKTKADGRTVTPTTGVAS
jgi:DNA-binding GntR family transcriptional regulator